MPKKAEEKKVGSATKTVAAKAEKKVAKKTTTTTKTKKESSASKKVEKPVSTVETTSAVKTNSEPVSYKDKASEIENNIMLKINANPAMANNKFRKLVSVNKLMETVAHIGLTTRKWNPKMKPYIYAKKGTNHIIDLMQTVMALSDAYNFLVNLTKNGGTALFVGTRGKIIKNHVKEESKRTQSFYINERWLGGTLTNFRTISNSIKKFNNLLVIHKTGEVEKYLKKEQVQIKKDTEKLAKAFGGIRTMKELPKVLILTDPENEKNALKEAKKLGIPVVAICNSNADPTDVDYVIPANNYSIKSVYLLIGILSDAIAEGKGLPKSFVGKKDDEIVLPEVIKKKPEYRKVVYNK
ncbi:30S ribosomal protein S2 [Malacoplasma iowae]|uniref:30S ribosomal protein S2 n=1 Tax=Malacoplasma iowae TaxID=2116 RepID=UPI002A18E871|nr:30S ribosomal protein S2 [Malacoplasma iowae]WPL37613.1 30S ribosomal protein S2 [Malacoplasma iowae]